MREAELEQAYGRGDPEICAAIAAGVDVSMLVENLKLTPTERLEQLQRVIEFFEDLRQASGHGATG
jgi:hypothetical protein